MKVPIKLKILLFLQKKIDAIPEGSKAPKWLVRSCLFVTWFFALPNKIKSIPRTIKNGFLSLPLILFFRNLHFVFFSQKSEAKAFSGWGYRWFAKKYADKRSEISKVNKLCGGKRHYVIPYDTGMMIVINRLEVNRLKQKNMIRKSYNVLDMFENAFYITR